RGPGVPLADCWGGSLGRGLREAQTGGTVMHARDEKEGGPGKKMIRKRVRFSHSFDRVSRRVGPTPCGGGRERALLLASDPILVAIEPRVQAVESVASLERRDRVAAFRPVSRPDSADTVRVARVQRPAIPVPLQRRDTTRGTGR